MTLIWQGFKDKPKWKNVENGALKLALRFCAAIIFPSSFVPFLFVDYKWAIISSYSSLMYKFAKHCDRNARELKQQKRKRASALEGPSYPCLLYSLFARALSLL